MQYLRGIKVSNPRMYLFSLALAFLLAYFVKSGVFSHLRKGRILVLFKYCMFGLKTVGILRVVFSFKSFVGI